MIWPSKICFRSDKIIADHTLLRHIGASGDSHDHRDSHEENVSAISGSLSRNESFMSIDEDVSVKRREPTPAEKVALREEMFSFFDASRQTENSMVCQPACVVSS
jgi:hypothetical protein